MLRSTRSGARATLPLICTTNAMLASLLALPDQLTFLGGMALALFGVYLRWRLGDFVMQTEEYVKERRLTEAQARRRIAVLELASTSAIVLGLAACVVVVWT